MLRSWIRILRRAPRSVVWLLRAPKVAEEAVRSWWEREAPDLEERLIFGDAAAKEDHLRRSALADVFLDTDIYGAHSTGTDALWSALPILAPTHLLPMAARVSASLLRTVGLELLVARSLDEYEALAVALVNKPLALLQVRQHLRRVRWSSPLFDTPRWMRDWERALSMLWNAHAARSATSPSSAAHAPASAAHAAPSAASPAPVPPPPVHILIRDLFDAHHM